MASLRDQFCNPLLFNSYIYDLPAIASKKFIYVTILQFLLFYPIPIYLGVKLNRNLIVFDFGWTKFDGWMHIYKFVNEIAIAVKLCDETECK